MATRRRVFEDRTSELKMIDDTAWCQGNAHALAEPADHRKLFGPLGINVDTNGFSDTDCVGELHFTSFSKICRNDILSDVAGHIGC